MDSQPVDPSLYAALRRRAAQASFASLREAAAVAPALLPVYLDWVGFIALREDGELLFVPWDPPHEPEIVQEARLRRTALVAAAEKFAELASLVPLRPAEAERCAACDGSGRPTVQAQPVAENIRCVCGGLGCLLPGEQS